MATTISIALPPNYSSPPPPPYTSLLKRPRSVSLSSLRTNPAFMTWLSILLLRVHQNALVAKWLSTWQWLGLPSTSSASVSGGSYETAWLRGWVAARQDYVMTCWDAVYNLLHPTATFKLPNLETKKRKLSLPPPPSSKSTSTSSDSEVPDSEKLASPSHEASTSTTTTLSEKYLFESSPESTVPDVVDSTTLVTSPPIIEVRLPPRKTSSSVFEEANLRNVQVEGDAGIIKTETEDVDLTAAGACSPVCDSGYASDEQEDVTIQEAEPALEALTFIDSPVIRKHNASFSFFESASTSSSCETIPLPLTDEFDDEDDETLYPTHFNGLQIPLLTLTPSPEEPFPEYVPIQLSYHGTYLSVPAKPCYESLVHARRALRCTIVGWWGEVPDSDDEEHDAELEADLEELGSEEMCVEDMVYWLEDDEEELPDLPDDW